MEQANEPLQQKRDPFLLIFPWGKVSGFLFLLFFGMFFSYRISETGGFHVKQACLAAIIIAGLAGISGFYVIGKTWGQDVYAVLIGNMIATAIRLLICGCGVAIITRFTDIHLSWFILFVGVYYITFMAVDISFSVWVLRNSDIKEQKERLHGNLWDIFG